jgi:hypothetical protein
MSLELVNTLASVATTVIIAATAVAAMVQLKHLRAGNQIGAQLELRQVLLNQEFWDAIGRMRFEIPLLMEEPGFRRFVSEYHTEAAASTSEDRYEVPYTAALVVGRNMENIGNMIRNRLIDGRIFLEQYANLVIYAWDAAEPLIKLRRAALKDDSPWEDFEYLTVLARRSVAEGTSAYPRGMPRILPSFADGGALKGPRRSTS